MANANGYDVRDDAGWPRFNESTGPDTGRAVVVPFWANPDVPYSLTERRRTDPDEAAAYPTARKLPVEFQHNRFVPFLLPARRVSRLSCHRARRLTRMGRAASPASRLRGLG